MWSGNMQVMVPETMLSETMMDNQPSTPTATGDRSSVLDTKLCNQRCIQHSGRSRACTVITMLNKRTVKLWTLLLLWLWMCTYTHGQESKQVEYTLYEETPSNSYMGDIRQSANLQAEFAPDVYKNLRYAILVPGSEYAQYFSMDYEEGTLRTSKPIDRERVCHQQVNCVINFDVAIQPREHFQIIKVSVIVEDVNDNAPSFINNHISRSIPENTLPGARFTLPAADDPDSPKFGVKRYEMMTGAPQFKLEVSQSVDGGADLQLILEEALDREVRDLYTVVIAAYDGGITPKTGYLSIDMIVLDVNDNYPKFDNETYSVTVPENVSKNSVIIKLRARDADALDSGQVVYSFTTKSQASYGETFGINNVTGEIFLKDILDYELNKIYNLGVIAHDKTPEALTSIAKVVIRVQDVNDHAPEITINALTTTGHVEISEGAPVDSFVAHIAVADPDSGMNGELSCSIDSQFFDIKTLGGQTSTEYKVVTTKTLDRETGAFHQVLFICRDKGLPSLTSTATIPVTVLDENDHDPMFSRPVYSAIIAENNQEGAFILQVVAEDSDSGDNAMLEYQLDPEAVGILHIDPTSGNITAKMSFDFEGKKDYQFRVIATDHGSPARSSSAIVELHITDTNDNPPRFVLDSYVFDVYENQPLGTEVGQVTATDADAEPFNAFMYFMDPGASATETFVVEPQTGKIFTRQELNRESQSQYQLVVMAVSQDAPSMQSSVKVTIHVADKNDNAPVLVFPHRHNDTVHVRSSTQLGARVATILAHDLDIGINSKLVYTILDGNDAGYFILDEMSGILAVREPLTELEDKLFILKFEVRDSGDPGKAVEAFLNVVVNRSVELTAPLVANHNLTIVISVAVVSGFLVIVLIAAIILTKRHDVCGSKPRSYEQEKALGPKIFTLEAEKVQNNLSVDPASPHTKKDMSYSHDIDMEEGGPPPSKYTSAPPNANTSFNIKEPAQYDPRTPSTYVSLYTTSKQGQKPKGQGQLICQGQPKVQRYQQQELAATSFDLKETPSVLVKDRDSDSTDSSGSNADSGRGSNDDTDSRPSISDSAPHVSDGVIMVPPLQPQGHSDSFKVKLSSVVKMQHDHVTDNLGHMTEDSERPPVIQPRRSSLMSKRSTNQNRLSNNGVPSRQPPRIPNGGARNAQGGSQQPTNRNSYYSHMSGNSKNPGYHENQRFHGNRVMTSDDDESESEYSDEDKEYVYYVNASHV